MVLLRGVRAEGRNGRKGRHGCKIASLRSTRGAPTSSLIMTAGIGMRAQTHGGCPTMNAGRQQVLQVAEPASKKNHSNGNLWTSMAGREIPARVTGSAVVERKPRVFVCGQSPAARGDFPNAGQERGGRSGRTGVCGTIPCGRPPEGRRGHPGPVIAWKCN